MRRTMRRARDADNGPVLPSAWNAHSLSTRCKEESWPASSPDATGPARDGDVVLFQPRPTFFMEAVHHRARRLSFGVFDLDLRTGELRKRGARVRLQQQPFQV